MNPFLEIYAECYDSIHKGKNYAHEVGLISKLFERHKINLKDSKVLDFGAGTGMHAKNFAALGISIEAYEPSVAMASQAKRNCASLTIYEQLEDITQPFDIVVSLFDVLSYQTTEQELQKYLKEILTMITPGGFVLLDSWHTPGVLLDPPNLREKMFEFEESSWLRRVSPVNTDRVDVFNLKIELLSIPDNKVHYSTFHKLKSYSVEEIENQLGLNGFETVAIGDTEKWDTNFKDTSWRFWILAKRV